MKQPVIPLKYEEYKILAEKGFLFEEVCTILPKKAFNILKSLWRDTNKKRKKKKFKPLPFSAFIKTF